LTLPHIRTNLPATNLASTAPPMPPEDRYNLTKWMDRVLGPAK